jgi:hypothetical protein
MTTRTTNIVPHGVNGAGENPFIAREYISHGRACALATDCLATLAESDIPATLNRKIGQERWTGLVRQGTRSE